MLNRTSRLLLTLLLAATPAFARGGGHGGGHRASSGSFHSSTSQHWGHSAGGTRRATYASGIARDKHGRIARSSKAKHEFERGTGYAHGRRGYVVDHIVPLKRGGADAPSNMQWQTTAEGKAKDLIE